jgi:hypothetical protein
MSAEEPSGMRSTASLLKNAGILGGVPFISLAGMSGISAATMTTAATARPGQPCRPTRHRNQATRSPSGSQANSMSRAASALSRSGMSPTTAQGSGTSVTRPPMWTRCPIDSSAMSRAVRNDTRTAGARHQRIVVNAMMSRTGMPT